MSIFERTIKIVLATCLAIWCASLLNLPYASSAGIIAILSVLDTRRSSVRTAFQRILSAVLALVIGGLFYYFIGVSLWVFGLYLTVYVPLAYRFNLQAGIAPSSVLVAHILILEQVTLNVLVNEFLLMLIGTGTALIFNAYMSSQQRAIQSTQLQVSRQMKTILLGVNEALLHSKRVDVLEDLRLLRQTIRLAKQLVYQEHDNQLFSRTNYYVHYFEMRDNQAKVLEQMLRHLHYCDLNLEESKILAGLFYLSANQLSETNSALSLVQNIDELRMHFRSRALPQSREEFEGRAILFQLLNDFTHFIQLKVDFYTEYQSDMIQE